MNIDVYKTIPFIFSSIAIIVSIITIIISKKNVKKQLRNNKLEEILEILYFLKGYYKMLYNLHIDAEEYNKIKLLNSKMPENLENFSDRKLRLSEIIKKESLINKVSKINVLSSAYLPNTKNLKYRIHSISTTYYYMYIHVMSNGNKSKNSEEEYITPNPEQFGKFIKKIQSDIVKEMNLGYKYIDGKGQNEYFKTQFLKDLESK